MDRRWKTTPRPSRLKIVCTENLEEQYQEYIPANKYGKERINRSQDSVKESNELTRKLDGNGSFLPSSSSSWWQSTDQWWQVSSWDEQFFFFFFNPKLQGVSLTGNGDSFVTDGRCKHYTIPAYIPHFRTREFSRVAQDWDRAQVEVVCVLFSWCLTSSSTCTSHSVSTSSFFERTTTLQSATWRTLWPNGWTEWTLVQNRKEVKRYFCKTRKEMQLTSQGPSRDTSCTLVQVQKRHGTLKSIQMNQKENGMNWQSKLLKCILYGSIQSWMGVSISRTENWRKEVQTCISTPMMHL